MMGYRMHIWPEGKEIECVGDDHKLYGYADFKNVKSSFSYLYNTALKNDDMFEWYDEFPNPADEAYGTFCAISVSPEITLTNKQFEIFTTLYLLDLIKCKPNMSREYFDIISGYMNKMISIPGNKILQWK